MVQIDEIKKLVANDRIEEAINQLLEQAQHDRSIYELVVLISGRYASIEEDLFTKGIKDEIAHATLRRDVLGIIQMLEKSPYPIKQMLGKSPYPIKVFLSYSSHDKKYVEQFRAHLMSLNDKYNLKIYYDETDLKIDDSIKSFVDTGIEEADIVFVFVSPDYFSSARCVRELVKAISKSDEGEQTLIPILLRETYWQGTKLSNYNFLPRNLQPIQSLKNKDLTFKEIISEIDTVFYSISKQIEEKEKIGRRIEIKLEVDFDDFDSKKQDELLEAITKILEVGITELKIVNKKKGSTKLTFEVDDLDEEKLKILKKALEEGKLKDVYASNIELSKDTQSNDNRRPRVFIGSSSEGLEIAESIQLNLDHSCEVTIWSQGVFGLGRGTLETLVEQLDNYDFSILVLTPDDMIESRGDLKNSARDNVLFELGLFMGRLGRYRTFAVYDRTADIKIPSDLAGVSIATYQPHSSGNIDAALGAPCTQMKRIIKEFGIIDKKE